MKTSLKNGALKEPVVPCPICGSKNTYWQLCGDLTCEPCGKIFRTIKKDSQETWVLKHHVVKDLNKLENEPNDILAPDNIDSMLYAFILNDPAEHFGGLKDSGARREFESGAVRDISEGKGRCDLLPLDVVGKLLNSEILECIEIFKETKDVTVLFTAIIFFSRKTMNGIETALLEVLADFEQGACKYGENNWKKGITLHCYLDSAVRHYLKHLRGDTDEPHDRAFVWNLLCAIWTFEHKPELDDVERDIAKKPSETIDSACDDLIKEMKRQLDIQSPSKVLYGNEGE